MQNKVTIIIPTLNNTKGLFSLVNLLKKTAYQIVVVDNNPTEEKKKYFSCLQSLTTNHQPLIYLPQPKNQGFAKGINIGSENIDSEWILILNDDIELNENTIANLIDYANKHNLVSVSPLLKNLNGKIENYGYKVLSYGKVELINNQSPITNHQIDGLTAACLLIKTDIFKKIGGFDESFFAYLEDVDLFLRIQEYFEKKHQSQKSNHQPLITNHYFGICPEVSVIHHHLTTSKTMGNFKEKQDLINWIRLIIKHPKHFELYNPFNLFLLIIERLRNFSGYLKSFFR